MTQVQERMDRNRKNYNLLGNNCQWFANQVVHHFTQMTYKPWLLYPIHFQSREDTWLKDPNMHLHLEMIKIVF